MDKDCTDQLVDKLLLDKEENLEETNQNDIEETLEEVNQNDTADYDGKICEFVSEMMKGKLDLVTRNEIIEVLLDCYKTKYRHSYSSISSIIYATLLETKDTQQVGPLEALAYNIENVKDEVLKKENEKEELNSENDNKVIRGINKFYDHIMLEITRINDYTRSMDEINEVISTFKNEYEDYRKETVGLSYKFYSKATRRIGDTVDRKMAPVINDIEKASNNIFGQIVAVLGIFAAIVIVFFGGSAIFSNVFTNIYKAKWYEVGFAVAIVGMVLFDIIFLLLYLVSKIIGKSIAVGKTYQKTYKNNIHCFCDRYPYICYYNVFMIFIMTIMIIIG